MLEGWILFILGNVQYFQRIDTFLLSNTQYFRRFGTHFFKSMRSISEKMDAARTKRYEVFPNGRYCFNQVIRSIVRVWILIFLSFTQYFRGSGTPFTDRYAVCSRGGYCLC